MPLTTSGLTSPIYVYAKEPGVDPFCSRQICSRIEETGIDSSRLVKLTDTSYLRRQLLSDKQATLIIPGGYSHVIAGNLENLVGNVKTAVSGGWNYLGLCAGGNFACKSLIAYQLKQDGQRTPFNFAEHQHFLNLLPVDAIVDVYPISRGADNGRIVTIETNSEKFTCLWNEGSKFVPKNTLGLNIEAKYTDLADKPIAVLSGTYGLGHVTITGVHPEADVSLQRILDNTFTEDDRYMLDKFGAINPDLTSKIKRIQFLHNIFAHVGILTSSENH